MKKLIAIASVVSISFLSNAQDFHLTQYEVARSYLNPAETGQNLDRNEDYFAAMGIRNQWSSISSKPFATQYLSYDARFKKRWGVGIYLVNNQATTNKFRHMNVMLSGAYKIIDDNSGQQIFTTGLSLGLINQSIGTTDFLYDSQYDGSTGTFNSGLESGENNFRNGKTNLDVNWGTYYKYAPSGEIYAPYIGVSLRHITFPNTSLINDVIARTPMLLSVNGGSDLEINKEWTVRPAVLFQYQKKATELNFNTGVKYQLENEDFDLRAQLGYRLKDAFIAGFGMRYKEWTGFASYDFNTSYLNNYTGGRGAFEFTLVYKGQIKNEQMAAMFR